MGVSTGSMVVASERQGDGWVRIANFWRREMGDRADNEAWAREYDFSGTRLLDLEGVRYRQGEKTVFFMAPVPSSAAFKSFAVHKHACYLSLDERYNIQLGCDICKESLATSASPGTAYECRECMFNICCSCAGVLPAAAERPQGGDHFAARPSPSNKSKDPFPSSEKIILSWDYRNPLGRGTALQVERAVVAAGGVETRGSEQRQSTFPNPNSQNSRKTTCSPTPFPATPPTLYYPTPPSVQGSLVVST
jgi:hypothetical protein